jgi:hypothetical protein
MARFFDTRLWPLAVLTLICELAVAKPDTAKLSITGPGISEAIETTAPAAIYPNIWGGQFADWAAVVSEPAADLPRYTVKFHAKTAPGKTQLVYVVHYVWDGEADRAYVYLPGPGDQSYRLNRSSIIRDGNDGHWYRASYTWSAAIRQLLPNQNE